MKTSTKEAVSPKNAFFGKHGFFNKVSSKISHIRNKGPTAKTPQLKSIRNVGGTPKARSTSKNKSYRRKSGRKSIGISTLSTSKISTPKVQKSQLTTKTGKSGSVPNRSRRGRSSSALSPECKPLMPRVLMSKNNSCNKIDPPTIVIDDTDEGIICDDSSSTKATVSNKSPEIEIIKVKITPGGSKTVKVAGVDLNVVGDKKKKATNPQRIFSKFNLPNPLFPKDKGYIPLSLGPAREQKRQTRNSSGFRGYEFNPNAAPDTNFTPAVEQAAGRVFPFGGNNTQSWVRNLQSFGNNRQTDHDKRRNFPTMGLNHLRTSSRSKLLPNSPTKSGVLTSNQGFGNVHVSKQKTPPKRGTLRTIVIDGQNVGVEHAKANGGLVQGSSKAPKLSSEGISICVDYFKKRGHKEVVVFVPQFRTKMGQCDNPDTLEKLNYQGILKYTPCRQINGLAHNSYDDRFIVQYAALTNGVIVSNDNYRDLAHENYVALKDVIDKRLLKFVWVGNTLMFSQDPLGRNGPTLEEFLKHS